MKLQENVEGRFPSSEEALRNRLPKRVSCRHPSIQPPMNAAAYLIWFSVVMVVGAVNGVVVGLVISWLRPSLARGG